ncbi:MAG: hypothetical protein P4L84_31125 [Isosphaeraceae bacterium]|nr:hypothetical protein [Isosphaeraceae bacterium]
MARRLGIRLGILAPVVLTFGAALPARGEVPKISRWVGNDAVIYVEAARPAELLDQVTGVSFQKLLGTIPVYSRYIKSDDYQRGRQVLDLIAGQLDTTWDKGLRDLVGGGAVLAVEAGEGKAPTIYLLVAPRDPAFLKRANTTLLELARKDAAVKGNPDPVKSAEYRGFTGYASGEKGAYAIVQDVLVIADRGDTVKMLVDRVVDGPKDGGSIVDDAGWKARHAQVKPGGLAWGYARLERLRQLDAQKFSVPEKTKLPQTLFFGSWIEALRKGPWVAASLSWSDGRLAADVTLPAPAGGYGAPYKGYVPPTGTTSAPLLNPPGTIASISLWRDLSALWETRADLLAPEEVQGLAQLDTVAGQFFGGRDFGAGVLGALQPHWRVVVAQQDYGAMKPAPDLKYPAVALVIDLKPDDDDFAQRLKVAFQSIAGLANLNAAQSKAPPLELGSETFEGVTIATTRFMPSKDSPANGKEPVHYRHNYSPSAAQVDSHFIISSSLGLTRDLIKTLKAPAKPGQATLALEADGGVLAGLLELNRNRIVMQNMLEKGNDKAQAEAEVGTLLSVLRYLGHGRLTVQDAADALKVNLEFVLGR